MKTENIYSKLLKFTLETSTQRDLKTFLNQVNRFLTRLGLDQGLCLVEIPEQAHESEQNQKFHYRVPVGKECWNLCAQSIEYPALGWPVEKTLSMNSKDMSFGVVGEGEDDVEVHWLHLLASNSQSTGHVQNQFVLIPLLEEQFD